MFDQVEGRSQPRTPFGEFLASDRSAKSDEALTVCKAQEMVNINFPVIRLIHWKVELRIGMIRAAVTYSAATNAASATSHLI